MVTSLDTIKGPKCSWLNVADNSKDMVSIDNDDTLGVTLELSTCAGLFGAFKRSVNYDRSTLFPIVGLYVHQRSV